MKYFSNKTKVIEFFLAEILHEDSQSYLREISVESFSLLTSSVNSNCELLFLFQKFSKFLHREIDMI